MAMPFLSLRRTLLTRPGSLPERIDSALGTVHSVASDGFLRRCDIFVTQCFQNLLVLARRR